MARLKRVTHKLFAENAPVVESGNTSVEIGQFGSALAGTYVATNDVATLQALPAYTRGWGGAVIADEQLPTLEDMNAVQRVQSYQTGYLFQEGIAEYDASSEYGIGSICKVIEGTDVKLYKSLIADNVGNPITDTNSWEELSFGGGGLEIGDIGFTQMAIDESLGKRRKLNGSIIIKDQYPVLAQIIETTQALFPNNFCTEEEWQAEVMAYGICGKYVIGTDTIRLPKYPDYFVADLANIAPVVGNGLTLGLMDGNGGTFGLRSSNATSNTAIYSQGSYGTTLPSTTASGSAPPNEACLGITSDPTKSGIEAKLNDVANKIYGTYFIQVATGSEYQENITNEIELNNPFVLLEGKYFETPVYNSSWLQSNASFTGSSALHPTAYNALLIEQNSNVEVGTTVDNYTKRGLSVKLDTEAYTDYDFVLNTTEQTFRCPLKINKASGKAVVGNGNILGMTFDGNNLVGIAGQKSNQGYAGTYTITTDNLSVPMLISGNTTANGDNKILGLTTDATKSGVETSDEDLYLYFYVGETVQNANLVNVGRVEEKLSNCLTRNDKEEITSWGTPDYTAGIDISSGFVAPCDGFVWVVMADQNTGTKDPTLDIDDIRLGTIQCTGYSVAVTYLFPISKGSVITTANTIYGLVFYPMKGTN